MILFYHDSINSRVSVLQTKERTYGPDIDDWPLEIRNLILKSGHGLGIYQDGAIRRLTDLEWQFVSKGELL